MTIRGNLGSVMQGLLPPKGRFLALAYKNYFLGDPILRRLPELVDPRRTAVDVGAYVGIYTYFLAKRCARSRQLCYGRGQPGRAIWGISANMYWLEYI